MKRLINLLLVFVLIMTMAAPIFADKVPNPNKPINKEEFYSSLASLLKEFGYQWEPIKGKGTLTREEMVETLGKYLLDENLIPEGVSILPFKDIKNMKDTTKKILLALYENNIIKGKTKNTFNPKSKVTFKEARIVLERIKGLLKEWDKDRKNIIPFKVINVVSSYMGEEGIVVKEKNDKVIVAISKKFSTPGYGIEVESVKRVGNKYEIGISITKPDKDAILAQVITYVTANIEIDKKDLGKKPYNFYVKERVKDMVPKNIPFKQLDIKESYSDQEGIGVKEEGDKLLVSITKEFPTPGYSMAIERIIYDGDEYMVRLLILPPKEDAILLQVLQYKTIDIELDKEDIGKGPYKFNVEIVSP